MRPAVGRISGRSEPGDYGVVMLSPTSDTPDAVRVREHPAVVRVRDALTTAGVITEIVVLDTSAHTAALAAEFLGTSVGQIANSLVFAARRGDGTSTPLLLMTSGAHRVDVAKVAADLGYVALERGSADLVREATGFAIGGVAPLGHPSPVSTYVDQALSEHDVIWAAAGHPRTVFATTYTDLLRMTAGTPLAVV